MGGPQQGPRCARRAVTVLAVAGTVLAAPTLSAARGYHDFLCRIPYGASAGRAAPADDVTYATNGTYTFAGIGCEAGGELYAAMSGDVSHPFGAGAWVTFSAPAGLTINGFTLWRYEQDGPDQPFGAPASNLAYSPGPPSVEGLCAQSLGCGSRGTPTNPLDLANEVRVANLSGVSQIQWSAVCGGGPGGVCPESGAGTYSSLYEVYAADIELVDSTPPTVSAIGGPLVTGGTLTGQQTVSFNASDQQSGVYGGSLVVDGRTVGSQVVDSSGAGCQSLGLTTDGQRSFEHAQPCAPSLSAALTLDTSQFAAGQHSLEVIAEDAAGNQTIAYDGTITTSGPSVAGVSGGSLSGARAHVANGTPCAGAQLEVETNGHRGVPLIPFGQPVIVKGVLHCGTVAIRGAQIAVATVGAPASLAINSAVQSGPDGSFAYKVPAGANRSLRFSYTAYSDDTSPSASALATIAIRPKIKLRIGPRATRNGETIHWSGTVVGGPYPRQGITLEVEVREGRRWKVFATVVAHRKGKFHYGYTFTSTTEPVTYDFRVALPDSGSGGYLYTHGASNAVNVHVTP
jgi:hypothetical protein